MTDSMHTSRSSSAPSPAEAAAAREESLADRADTLIGRAREAGAEEAEVFVIHSETTAARFEKGDLKLTTVEEGASIGLRVFRERRLGFSCTNQTDAEALERTAGDAVALARLSPPDAANALPAPHSGAVKLALVQDELASLSVEEVVERARDMVARTLAVDPRIALDQASVQLSRSSAAVCSTAGARATESDAAFSLSVFGMAVDGEDVGGFDYWGATLRDAAAIEGAVAESIERFTTAALGNLGAGAAESYAGPVLFSPAAFQSAFVSPLLGAANARAVQRGRSALAGKLGEPIGAAALTIVDRPHDPELAGVAAFDREGVPTRTYPVLEGGVLAGYLYDGHAARLDGVEPTGHAVGGPRSVPAIGAHGPCVEPGAGADGSPGGDAAALRRQLGRGLLVQRFSGSVDPASGDFSGVAKSARWVEGGEVVRPVRETLISGNVFELLPRIVALSSAAENVMGTARVPWVIVDGVAVTAG